MSRQERRKQERLKDKVESKLYTYDECVKMMAAVMKETQSQYNIRYSTCLATALSAPPFNFESEYVCEIVKLFFDQIEALSSGIVTDIQIKEEAAKLGISVSDNGCNLIVDINPIKNNEEKRGTDMKNKSIPVSKTEHEADFMKIKCEVMIEQFKNKNVAYGDSFGVQFRKYGPISALVRMSDKFSRMESLMTGVDNKVADERLEDTLVDMACYCLMALYEIESGKVKVGDKL